MTGIPVAQGRRQGRVLHEVGRPSTLETFREAAAFLSLVNGDTEAGTGAEVLRCPEIRRAWAPVPQAIP